MTPSFLPPPYDFTTEEDEDDTEEEEENENTCKGLCACKIFYGTIFALVVYKLIGSVTKIDKNIHWLKQIMLIMKKPQCTCK